MSSRFLYIPADTVIHRLHPITKLVGLVLCFAAVMSFNHPLYEGALLVLSVALLVCAGAAPNLARTWRFLSVIFVASAVLWVLFVKDIEKPTALWSLKPTLIERGTAPYALVMVLVGVGLAALALPMAGLLRLVIRDLRARTPYRLALWLGLLFCGGILWAALRGFPIHLNTPGTQFEWGPTVVISREALLYGLAMGLRIAGFLAFGLLFISTTSPDELTQGLRAAGMPLTPSVALSLAFRLVPTFTATARTVMDAQRARGLDLDVGGALARLRRTAPVIVPTLAYALRSADDLTRALETRGLGAARKRTDYRPLRFGAADVVALVLGVAFAAACVWARVEEGAGVLLPRL